MVAAVGSSPRHQNEGDEPFSMQSRGIQVAYLSVELNTHTERVDEDTHQDTPHKVLALNDLLHLLCQHT